MPSMARVTIVRNRRPRYVQSIRYYAVLRQMCANPRQTHDRRCERAVRRASQEKKKGAGTCAFAT